MIDLLDIFKGKGTADSCFYIASRLSIFLLLAEVSTTSPQPNLDADAKTEDSAKSLEEEKK
jgi:hypothetical protein